MASFRPGGGAIVEIPVATIDLRGRRRAFPHLYLSLVLLVPGQAREGWGALRDLLSASLGDRPRPATDSGPAAALQASPLHRPGAHGGEARKATRRSPLGPDRPAVRPSGRADQDRRSGLSPERHASRATATRSSLGQGRLAATRHPNRGHSTVRTDPLVIQGIQRDLFSLCATGRKDKVFNSKGIAR